MNIIIVIGTQETFEALSQLFLNFLYRKLRPFFMQNCIFKCKIEFDYDNTSFQLDISARGRHYKIEDLSKSLFYVIMNMSRKT